MKKKRKLELVRCKCCVFWSGVWEIVQAIGMVLAVLLAGAAVIGLFIYTLEAIDTHQLKERSHNSDHMRHQRDIEDLERVLGKVQDAIWPNRNKEDVVVNTDGTVSFLLAGDLTPAWNIPEETPTLNMMEDDECRTTVECESYKENQLKNKSVDELFFLIPYQ